MELKQANSKIKFNPFCKYQIVVNISFWDQSIFCHPAFAMVWNLWENHKALVTLMNKKANSTASYKFQGILLLLFLCHIPE